MPVEITCSFHKVLITAKQAVLQRRLNKVFLFFGTKGQVTPKSVVYLAGIGTCSIFYACPDYLQVS